MNNFSVKSSNLLNTCHIDLQKIFNLAVKRSKVDFGIAEGNRSIAKQQELFKQGKSKIDGVKKLGKHNYSPSLAVDIFVANSQKEFNITYDVSHLCYIAGVVQSCAVELLEKKEISHEIRWGGNWDNDGILVLDQNFDDLVHFELI